MAGSAALLAALKITKRKRSAYDHIMLHLHDAMKADLEYQGQCPQETMPFPPGCAWVCFSDHASHAVMSGQFMLEQTFYAGGGDERFETLPAEFVGRHDRQVTGLRMKMVFRWLKEWLSGCAVPVSEISTKLSTNPKGFSESGCVVWGGC